MAGREKKPASVKKQSISLTPSKDGDNQLVLPAEKTSPVKLGTASKQEAAAQSATGAQSAKLIKPKKNQPTKPIKKNLQIKFKTKNKNAKKLKLSKSLFKNNKHLDKTNVTIVSKNGIKRKGVGKPRKTKAQAAANAENKDKNDADLPPPVLEPMTTSPEVNVTPKKEPKKRTKKQAVTEETNESVDKKIKIEVDEPKETVEDVLNDVANELQLDMASLTKKPACKKPRVTKKVPKQPAAKPRKPTTPKKPKAETRGRKGKEMIIETLKKDTKLDTDAQNVINKLDLNVGKTIKKPVTKKRRHSIEKFSTMEDSDNANFETPFNIFNVRRSASPKTKRNARIRQSVENVVRRFSPYSTRSDSPARILRNGKHRKLKGGQLLEGLGNEYKKKRRRLCSELTVNELSKFSSDYLSESDSNFSDMTSIENGTCEHSEISPKEGVLTKSDLLRKEILESIAAPTPDELQNLNIKSISTKFTAILKRSLSTETSQLNQEILDEVKPKSEELNSSFIDTNSNDVKPQLKSLKTVPNMTTSTPNDKEKTDMACDSVKVKKEVPDETVIDKIAASPSYKVPEKSFILDQMKQIFNDAVEEEKRTTRSSVKRTLKLSSSEEPEIVPIAKFFGTETSTSEIKVEEENNAFALSTDDPASEEREISMEEEVQKIVDTLQEIEDETPIIEKPEIPATVTSETLKEEDPLEEKDINCEENSEIVEEKLKETEEVEKMEIETIPEIKEEIKQIQDDLLKRLTENTAISVVIKDTEEKAMESEEKTMEAEEKDMEAVEKAMEAEEKAMEAEEKAMEEEEKAMEAEENAIEAEEKAMEAEEKAMEAEEKAMEAEEKTMETEEKAMEAEEKAMEAEEKAMEEEEKSMAAEEKPMEAEEKQEEREVIEENKEEIEEDMKLEVSIEEKEDIKEEKEETIEKKIEFIITEVKSLPETVEEQKEDIAIVETPEEQLIKENILNALGLQSLRAAEEAKLREKQKTTKNDGYTGTLKTVIKLNRNGDSKKKGKERNSLKLTLQKSKSRNSKDDCDNLKIDGASGKNEGENACYKVMKEGGNSSGWRHGSHSSDTAGANRKSHYSNRSNTDGSSEHASDNDTPAGEAETTADTKTLVIPEKASSFSIHPGRLCSDECAYCFGKFGLFDTPLHIAQIKSVERQDKILANEVYLMRDSCLCDACYRHVDRRNTPGAQCSNKSYKRTSTTSTIPRPNYCHVLACGKESTNVLRRKWLMKMRKSVVKIINVDLDNPGLHSIPVCAEHYAAVEHLMVCALCKRRLARNHIHYLGNECDMLNAALQKEGIPVTLNDKPVVCKPCRYFASLLLKPPPLDSQSNTAEFFRSYKKRLLHFHDIEVMDEAEAEEPLTIPVKDKSDKGEKSDKDKGDNKEGLKKKIKNKSCKSIKLNTSGGTSNGTQASEPEQNKTDQTRVPCNSENGESRASTPSDNAVDYETLVPNLSLECSDVDETKNEVPNKMFRKMQLPESVREAVEISKIMKFKRTNLVERLGSNPSISVRQLFQGEEDLPLQANIDFNNIKERTPEGWEKSVCTIQYDTDTKHLWQELQKPYGNQSSFLRHLILLEKYFRNGDLTLSPNASHHAVNYSVSVQNRLRAYDNIPSNSVPMQPLTMLPFNQVKKSNSGIITTREPQNISLINAANIPKNTPISFSQLNPNFLSQLSVRQKTPSVPPGLISLQPGTNRPVQSVRGPQKLKVPIPKNWKPTLIPVSASAAQTAADRRLSGVVQVISGGKPYHISLADYNKMCYLKKNQEMRKMAIQEAMKMKNPATSPENNQLKPAVPRKPKPLGVTITPKPVVTASATATATVTSISALKEIPAPSASLEILKDNQESSKPKPVMILPKMPKSLTVIPQTVPRKPLQPTSPTLSITTKPSTSRS